MKFEGKPEGVELGPKWPVKGDQPGKGRGGGG